MKKYLLLPLAVLIVTVVHSQSLGLNNDGSAPHASAMLDVKNPNKGILVPRVALTGTTDVATIPSPATSLLVYNTATTGDVTPGYYYYNGTSWLRFYDAASTASTATYSLGQSIYGGTIFWLDSTKQHGLIAATSDVGGSVQWANGSYLDTRAVRSGVYGGAYNTNQINYQQGTGSYASVIAAQYSGGNFGDWYLPSKDELNLMYQKKNVIGNFSGTYWSSTEVAVSGTDATSDYAWSQDFGTGTQDNTKTKNQTFKVRPIRRF